MQTDIIGVTIGILGIVIGVAVSYYFYRKSIRIKEPVYSIRSNNLITGNVSTLENLKITYKDYKVENLTVSKILFYNRGSETITKQDIETKNHLTISSETCKVLDASILQINHDSNNVQVSYNPLNKNVLIDFEYLDKNQGAVIQVIHTGLSSKNLTLTGDIMGVHKVTELPSVRFITNRDQYEIKKRVPMIIISLLIIIVSILWVISTQTFFEPLLALLGGIVGIFVTMSFQTISSRPRLLFFTSNYVAPNGLEKFLE